MAPPIGYWDEVPAVAIQKDGKIVVVGLVALAKRHTQLGLVRYLPSGELDTGFGENGTVVTNFAALGEAAVAIQPDGKIVAACGLDGPRSFGVGRYESDGTLDAGFGDGGKVRTRFPGGAGAHAVLVQPDGKIVVGGTAATTSPLPATRPTVASTQASATAEPSQRRSARPGHDWGRRESRARCSNASEAEAAPLG